MDTQLVPQQQDPFQMMERMDEQQVLDEIKGRAIDKLVYEIQQGGQTVVGLSLAGVREVVRTMNKNGQARISISDKPPVIRETDEYVEVMAYAQDVLNGGGNWGVKRQEKKFRKRNGDTMDDPFALEKALAKAQRNAQRGLIPEYFAKSMIEQLGSNGRGNNRQVHVSQPKAQPQTIEHKETAPTGDGSDQPRITKTSTDFWLRAQQLGIEKPLAQEIVAKHGNDWTAAIASLESLAKPVLA